jgi:hypothetical protein
LAFFLRGGERIADHHPLIPWSLNYVAFILSPSCQLILPHYHKSSTGVPEETAASVRSSDPTPISQEQVIQSCPVALDDDKTKPVCVVHQDLVKDQWWTVGPGYAFSDWIRVSGGFVPFGTICVYIHKSSHGYGFISIYVDQGDPALWVQVFLNVARQINSMLDLSVILIKQIKTDSRMLVAEKSGLTHHRLFGFQACLLCIYLYIGKVEVDTCYKRLRHTK